MIFFIYFFFIFQMRYYKSILHAQGISIWGLRLWGRALLVSPASSIQLNCWNNWRPRRWTRCSPLQRIIKREEASVYVSTEAGESARFPSDGSAVFYFSHFLYFLECPVGLGPGKNLTILIPYPLIKLQFDWILNWGSGKGEYHNASCFQLIVLRVFFRVNIRHPPKYKKNLQCRDTTTVLELYWSTGDTRQVPVPR